MIIKQKIRLLLGALLSPLVVPLLVNLTFLFIFGAAVEKDHDIQTSISTATWLSYWISLVLGVGSYIALQKTQRRSVQMYLLAGAAIGLVSWLLFSFISQTLVSLLFYVFVAAGVLYGLCFWLIVFFQPDGNYSSSSRRRRRKIV